MQWFYITYSLFFFFNKWQFEKNDYQFKETFIKQQDNLFNQQINKLRGETDLLDPSLHSYPSITELQERVPLLSEVLVLGFGGVFCGVFWIHAMKIYRKSFICSHDCFSRK